jgi:GntR family transcriptional regulator
VREAATGGRDRPDLEPFFARVGQLDRDSAVPLYYQLQEVLKREIDAGDWAPGQLLPSEAAFEARLGLSRTVVRKALDVLEADGQVVRRKGRGTTVARPKLSFGAAGPAHARPGSDAARAHLGRTVDARVGPAGRTLGLLLDVPAPALVHELTTRSDVGTEPAALTQAFVPAGASALLGALAAEGTAPTLVDGGPEVLDQLAERYGLVCAVSELTVEATTANEFESEALQIGTGAATFLTSTLVRDGQGRPAAFLRAVVRSDHFRFTATVVHPPR